ncbi:MAG: hypothetical protein AVDCRST_MAG39-481 [uncultured Sphingomonadaceae bacterium]|uniref:DUF4136 domain-containing protein n=1 Tax=uncultured Sphingomonadaceae bacterium TaxID=169976 RepID=A0A6J4S4P9_9SPHN|nr:MAG: hypothetical protein AVDCRST_MAG39-481 [uncultured Sphingomonadaceae bacterium]
MSTRIVKPAAIALLALAGIGGAAEAQRAGRPAPVQVTRVHLENTVTPAPTDVEARARGEVSPADMTQYQNAVAAQLVRIKFRPATADGGAAYVATVDVLRGDRAGVLRRVGPLTGVRAADSPSQNAGQQAVLLSVQLQRRADGSVVWEGRAIGPARGDAAATARRLSAALFRGFPGASGQTIAVR